MDPGRLENEVANASQAFAQRADAITQRRLVALCTARDALRGGRVGWDETSSDER
jgi:hypothetical protein